MRKRRATWRRIALIVLAVGLAIGGLSLAFLLPQSSLRVESRHRDEAFAEMDRVRARFGDVAPCVGAGSGEPRLTRGERPLTVFMLAWEREDDRLVRVTTPYWALRVAGWKVAVARSIAPVLDQISVPELERCGRGLIVDRRTAGGGRVLIWAE